MIFIFNISYFSVRTRENHRKKLAKLIQPIELILSNNITVSFDASRL